MSTGCTTRRREGYIQSEFTKDAKKDGWKVFRMMFIGRVGCPDLFLFKAPGRLAMAEMKDKNGKLSAAQRRIINWFKANGFDCEVIDSIERGREWLQELRDNWRGN